MLCTDENAENVAEALVAKARRMNIPIGAGRADEEPPRAGSGSNGRTLKQ
jgi:hypothetical protein